MLPNRVHQNCATCVCMEVSDTFIRAVVAPTAEQLAQAGITARMLEDDREHEASLSIQHGGGR